MGKTESISEMREEIKEGDLSQSARIIQSERMIK